MWRTDQIRLRELDASAQGAIVQQRFHAQLIASVEEGIRGLAHRGVPAVIQRHDVDVERRHRGWPHDAGVVVALLHYGAHQPRHTHAVAAHRERHILPATVLHGEPHRFAVLHAEFKDVAHLDAVCELEGTLAVRRWVSGHDVAQIRRLRPVNVPAPVRAGQVEPILVGAAYEAGKGCGGTVHIHGQGQPHRADGTRGTTQRIPNRALGGERHRLLHRA